jgi:hypothetical protein
MAREKTPVKTLAYLTTDEVNEATVARMASAYGAIVVGSARSRRPQGLVPHPT